MQVITEFLRLQQPSAAVTAFTSDCYTNISRDNIGAQLTWLFCWCMLGYYCLSLGDGQLLHGHLTQWMVEWLTTRVSEWFQDWLVSFIFILCVYIFPGLQSSRPWKGNKIDVCGTVFRPIYWFWVMCHKFMGFDTFHFGW